MTTHHHDTAKSKSASKSSSVPKLLNPRFCKLLNSNKLHIIELTRDDITLLWNEPQLWLLKQTLIHNAIHRIKESKNVQIYLERLEYFVEECLNELNNIQPNSSDRKENENKHTSYPQMSLQSHYFIYKIIPFLTKYLINSTPNNTTLVFAVNHFLRLILFLCKKFIEFDIECFRLLEMIFGFKRTNNSHNKGFYDHCGLPKPFRVDNIKKIFKEIKQHMNHISGFNEYIWQPKEYVIGLHQMSIVDDYPNDYTICVGCNQLAQKQSWFRVQNINYFCRIGGFNAIFKRISDKKSPMLANDLVNLFRPVVQLRNLYNKHIYQEFVEELYQSLWCYYNNLPDYAVEKLNEKTVENSLTNLHYMMGGKYKLFSTAFINKRKVILRLQVASTQCRSPFLESRIKAMHKINKYVLLAIERDKFIRKHRLYGSNRKWKRSFTNHQTLLLTLGFEQFWIQQQVFDVTNGLQSIFKFKFTDSELVKLLGPIYNLLEYNQTIDLKHIKPLLSLPINQQLTYSLIPCRFHHKVKRLSILLVCGWIEYVRKRKKLKHVHDDVIYVISIFYFS
eukprot:291750_1